MTTYPGPLTSAEFTSLLARSRDGDEVARNRLLAHNMRLVVVRARRLALLTGRDDLTDDFIQAGAIGSETEPTGLLRAIQLFDPARGCTFATFARSWIDAGMLAVLASRAPIAAISRSELSKRILIRRIAMRLERELCRHPTVAEVRAAFFARGNYSPSVACVERYFENAAREPYAGDIDDVPSRMQHAEALLTERQESATLDAALAQLTPTERRVIAGRFGLADADAETLRELGESLDLSRERVRQIEAGAMRKLRKLMGGDGITQ